MRNIIFTIMSLFTFQAAGASYTPLIYAKPFPLLLGNAGERMQTSDTTTVCNSASKDSFRNNNDTFQWCDGTIWTSIAGGGAGGGTVTSVGLAAPSVFTVSGSPVTTTGTLTLTYSGTALPIANGGTGLTSGTSGGILGYTASGTLASSGALTANQLIIGGGAGVTPSTLAAGSQYQVLRMGATTPAYGSINLDQSAAITGALPLVNGGTGTAAASANAAFNALSPMTTGGDLIYGGASGAATRLANGSAGQVLTSSGTTVAPTWATPSTVATAVPLSGITAATTTNTIANANNAQVWNWDTLTSETAMSLASTSMTSGSLLTLTDSFNNASSVGGLLTVTSTGTSNASTGIIINHAGTNAASIGMKINKTGNGVGPALSIADSASATNTVGALIAMSATSSNGQALKITSASNSGSGQQGMTIAMAATNAPASAIDASNTSTDSGAINMAFALGSASATGTNIQGTHGGTSGLNFQLKSTGTGIRDQARIDNTVTAANGSGSSLQFAANRTGTTDTVIAGVAAIITDITAGAYKGALILQTANNAVPAERMRIDNLGDVIITTAVVSGTGTTAGLSVTANSLTTGNGADISSTSLTTGNLVSLASTGTAAASSTQTVLNIATSGTNGTSAQTTYGAQIANTHAGTTSTNVGLYATASGGTTANYAAIFAAGNVGVGLTAPTSKIHVDAGTATAGYEQFTANATTGQAVTDGFLVGIDSSANAVLKQQENLPMIFYTNNTERFRISAAGLMSQGTAISPARLTMNYVGGTDFGITVNDTNSGAGSGFIIFTIAAGTGIGSVTNSANVAVLYNTTSDERLKENIKPTEKGLDTLSRLQVKDFNFIKDPDKTERQGFIAQEVYKIYPDAVHVGGEDMTKDPWGMDYGRLTPLLVKSIQELTARVKELEQRGHCEH